MKVLMCSPYKGAVGGIQRWTNHIARYYFQNIDSRELEIDFFCLSRKRSIVSDIGFFKRLIFGFLEYPILLYRFNKELGNKCYDVVHITSSASLSLLKDIAMLWIARSRNVKSIIHFRFGRIPELYSKRNWEYRLFTKVQALADLVIVLDQRSYDILIHQGCKNVTILANPVAPEIEYIIQKNGFIKRQNRVILFVGHVIPSKGVFELLQVCKSIENVRVKLVGPITNDMRLKLEHFLDADVKWLEILGEQDFESIVKEMLSAGVFVHPSYTEGFPNVILESMACGCPIVATSVGAIPEMLNVKSGGKFGVCVEPMNTNQLGFEIKRMLDDPESARKCGFNARERVNEMYSMPVIWNRMSDIWKSLIK